MKGSQAMLNDCKVLKMNHLLLKELSSLQDNMNHIHQSIQHIEGFPDERYKKTERQRHPFSIFLTKK